MDLEVCFVENGLVLVGVLELCQNVQEGGWQLWVNKAYSNSSRGVTPPPDSNLHRIKIVVPAFPQSGMGKQTTQSLFERHKEPMGVSCFGGTKTTKLE